MSTTQFIDGVTPIVSSWLNDVNRKTYAENVSVKDFGAKGDGVTDDTLALQAAISACVRTNPGMYNIPNTVFFPQGTYKVSDEISITGAISILGEAPNSYAGTFVIQSTPGKHLFKVVNTSNSAIYFDCIGLKAASPTAQSEISLVYLDPSVNSGNSFYFRNSWFQTPERYAINIPNGDDLQIINCTFDVTATSFIKIGGGSNGVTNVAIIGNTFYAGTTCLGFIDVFKVNGLIVTGNRIYGGGFQVPYFINANFVGAGNNSGTVISDNELNEITCLLITKFGNYTISNNTSQKGGRIAFAGGGTVSSNVITGNAIRGSSATLGMIDSTGTNFTYSIIQNNLICGNDGGSSQFGINIPTSSSQNNKIGKNLIYGVTQPYNLASALANGLDAFYTTPTISLGSVAAQSLVSSTITVVGASLYDEVTFTPVTPSWPLPFGVICNAWVSAENTISFQYQNLTAGSVTLNSHQWSFRIRRNDSNL